MCAVATWLGRSWSGGSSTRRSGQAESTNSSGPMIQTSCASPRSAKARAIAPAGCGQGAAPVRAGSASITRGSIHCPLERTPQRGADRALGPRLRRLPPADRPNELELRQKARVVGLKVIVVAGEPKGEADVD